MLSDEEKQDIINAQLQRPATVQQAQGRPGMGGETELANMRGGQQQQESSSEESSDWEDW